MLIIINTFFHLPFYRLVVAHEEHQRLKEESEPAKRKAENGYDRWVTFHVFKSHIIMSLNMANGVNPKQKYCT